MLADIYTINVNFITICILLFFILHLFILTSSTSQLYLQLFILLSVILILYYLQNPSEAFTPYNFIIENIYDKKVFYTDIEKKNIFPASLILENNWIKIRNECIGLMSTKRDKTNIGKQFVSNTDDFWKGWNTIVLRSFNKDSEENMNKCPILSKILKENNNITTAMFSILEPGKKIPSHYGPYKGILRYHLCLICPPKDSGQCFISVDGETYDWIEGEGILFDETYKHFVINDTAFTRVVLFLDVKRPLYFSFINDILLYLMGISPYNFF